MEGKMDNGHVIIGPWGLSFEILSVRVQGGPSHGIFTAGPEY
jgi:hypothetical protein